MTETSIPAPEAIPEGYFRNAIGHLVPKDLINEIDLTRDELVREIIARAEATQKEMRDFKVKSLADLMAFVELSAEKYNVKMGGIKGNISFVSFDGQYKIQIAVAERVVFDERIHAAKEIIDQCIHKWTEGTGAEIRALVEHAFQTDKEGNISLSRILSLTQLKIEDELWKKGIDALRDSMQVAGTNTYMRLYKRTGQNGKYEQISMDMAAI